MVFRMVTPLRVLSSMRSLAAVELAIASSSGGGIGLYAVLVCYVLLLERGARRGSASLPVIPEFGQEFAVRSIVQCLPNSSSASYE